jgi:membrane-bound inhibitor of C-type lysozyme
LRIATSADGARYTGDGWQWWTKGMHEGSLAALAPGEAIASAAGVACHAP